METTNVKSMLTPEPALPEINASQHDYTVAGPSSVKPRVSKSTSYLKGKKPPSTPKEERKRSTRPRLSATLDANKDSQLDSQVSSNRTFHGRLLQTEKTSEDSEFQRLQPLGSPPLSKVHIKKRSFMCGKKHEDARTSSEEISRSLGSCQSVSAGLRPTFS
ncbi:uncharacterized protein LOC142353624 [Convolutriloba macropyga]|uniref:uncharacterized protein LOC142353624 n=1 Tax=Convolutriloba macropyga TaxID=536237 RepID=UPI003F51DDA6